VWAELRPTKQQSISPTGYLEVSRENISIPYNSTVARNEKEFAGRHWKRIKYLNTCSWNSNPRTDPEQIELIQFLKRNKRLAPSLSAHP